MDLFRLIKILDDLQEYSKSDVINEYELCDDEDEQVILSKSIYPTGEPLGYYNYSKNNLSTLAKLSDTEIKDEFLDYIDSYSENIYEILEEYDIDDIVSDLSNVELLKRISIVNHQTCDDFLTDVCANILAKNNTENILFSSNFTDNYLEFLTAIKLKQINPKFQISFSFTEFKELSQIFNFIHTTDSNNQIYDLTYQNSRENFLSYLTSNSNSIILVKSSLFDENMDLLNHIDNPNNLEAIISLPIFYDEDNLIVISINRSKNSNDFIFIDESESLIHKNNDYDYSFAQNELLPKILGAYLDYEEYENALIMPVSLMISKKSSTNDFKSLNKYLVNDEDVSKKRVYRSEVDKLISLQEQQTSIQEEMMRHNRINVESDTPQGRFNYQLRPEELMYVKKRQPLENLLYKHEKRLLDEDVKFVNLAEIADLRSINQKNDNDSILVAACKACTSKLVNYNHDIDEIKPNEYYIEIENISSDVLKQYLYTYLSSFNGLDEIRYFSKKNHMITPEQLGFVKIPILKHTTQLELVDAVRESEEFFKSIELLRKDFQSNILDYKHVIDTINELRGDIGFSDNGDVKVKKSMRHAYSDLIWPLASSYLQATKGGFEIVEKKDNYMVLFEFVAAFNFIILLSGLPENVYQKCKYDIWNSRNKNIYKDMTFGKWVILSENIAGVYRLNNFSSKLDELLFNKISSNKILKILDKTKEYRKYLLNEINEQFLCKFPITRL